MSRIVVVLAQNPNPDQSSSFTKMSKKYCVLLTTFNGSKFLPMQLQSLANQDVSHLDIWLRDHGSTDSTLEIVRAAQSAWTKGRFVIVGNEKLCDLSKSPLERTSENFLHLIRCVDGSADFFAFCDQDDVWDKDKLSVAGTWLANQPVDKPALYCTRTRLVDEDLNQTGLSPNFTKKPDFRNAIVQNIAGGNTMVVNAAAISLLKKTPTDMPVVIHDWWSYILISGAGGNVHYSPTPNISYRQHSDNIVGENMSLSAKRHRLGQVLAGRFREWNNMNREAIRPLENELSPEARKTLALFDVARSQKGIKSMYALMKSGIYRQSILSQLSLYLSCAIKKI